MGQNLLNGGEGIVLAHADDGLHGGDVVGMARIVSVAFHDGQEGPVLLHGGHVVPDALEGSGPDEGDDGQVEPVVVLGGCPWLLLLLCLLLPLFLGQTLLVLLLLLLHPRVQLEGGVGHVHGILVVAQSAEGSGQVEKDGDVGPRELSSGRAEGLVAVEGRRRRRGAVHHRQIQAAVGGHLEVLGGGGQVVGPVGDVAEVVLDEHPQERHVPGEVGGYRIEHRPGNLVRFAGLLVGPVVLVEQADVEEGEGREGVGLLDLGGHGRGGRLESPPALLHDAPPPVEDAPPARPPAEAAPPPMEPPVPYATGTPAPEMADDRLSLPARDRVRSSLTGSRHGRVKALSPTMGVSFRRNDREVSCG